MGERLERANEEFMWEQYLREHPEKSMHRNALDKLTDEILADVKKLQHTKGEEYAANLDVLDNFKRNGMLLQQDPKIIWSVYFMKHIDAIMSYCRKGHVESDESIEGRIRDAINYLCLLQGLIMDEDGYMAPRKTPPSNIILCGGPEARPRRMIKDNPQA